MHIIITDTNECRVHCNLPTEKPFFFFFSAKEAYNLTRVWGSPIK